MIHTTDSFKQESYGFTNNGKGGSTPITNFKYTETVKSFKVNE